MSKITACVLSTICCLVLWQSLAAAVSDQARDPQAKTQRQLPIEIENPAGLASFFHALVAIKSGRRLEPVRIMHFGDSHTAADILTGAIRRRFQADFGDGGAGFMVPRNPMTTRRRGVSSGATAGWLGMKAPDLVPGSNPRLGRPSGSRLNE